MQKKNLYKGSECLCPKYTYEFNRQQSILTIWKDERTLCIMHDVTQRSQAKYLFNKYVLEMEIQYGF